MALVRPSQVQRSAGGAKGVPRDGKGRPMIIPKGGGKPKAYTRASTFADCIDDKTNLDNYHKRMVMRGATTEKGQLILEKAAPLDWDDKDDKQKLNRMADELMELAGAGEKSKKGTHLHERSEEADRGERMAELSDEDLADMAAYKLATIDLDVLNIECFLVCTELEVAGTADRIDRYVGIGPQKYLVDWNLIEDLKTGSVEYGGTKMSAQLSIYSRSEFYDFTKYPAPDRLVDPKGWEAWKKVVYTPEQASELYSPLPDVRQDWGIIVNVPAGTGDAQLVWADLNFGWRAALLAREIRTLRREGSKALVPFGEIVGSNR